MSTSTVGAWLRRPPNFPSARAGCARSRSRPRTAVSASAVSSTGRIPAPAPAAPDDRGLARACAAARSRDRERPRAARRPRGRMTTLAPELVARARRSAPPGRTSSACRRSCAPPATAPGRSGYRADRDLRRARPPARVVDRHRTRRGPAQGVRQPPRGRLRAVRRALPPGRLPPDRRRPARRQGRPRHRHRAPGAVRHTHRAELRAGPHAPARTRRAAAALPAAARRAGLRARRAALLRACARRRRPVPGRADLPRLL